MKKLLFLTTALAGSLAATMAHAEPVTIAIFGSAFAATTAGAIVSFGFSLAFTYGVSLLQKALMKTPEAKPQGVEVDIKMGDDQPIRFCMGQFATAGVRKYTGTWGKVRKTPNAYFVDVIELSNIPVPAGVVNGMWVDEEKVTIEWDKQDDEGFYPIKEYYSERGSRYLRVKFYDGTQTQGDPYLQSKFGGDPDHYWNMSFIGRGCAYAIIEARFNEELYSGAPTFLFEMKPLAVYDLRKDSTNGGSGSHRWGQPSTYEPSTNNAVLIYNIIRGIYYGEEWIFGGQNIAASRLPSSSWIAAANECDALAVIDSTTKTEKQFRAGVEITGDMEPLTVIDDLRKGCNGRLAEVGGTFKLLVGAPGAAVYSFTDDDIVVTEDQSFDPFPTLDQTFNGIEATYPEPEEKWSSKDAPGRYDADLEKEDGDRRLISGVTFATTPFPNQVQRLMVSMLKDQRRFRIHQFYLPPDSYALEPNDVVSWSSDRNGYVNKKFLVVDITGEATFLQLVTLHEIDPADYDWSPGFHAPTIVSPVGPTSPPTQAAEGFSAVASTMYDSDGVSRRPTIKVSAEPDLEDVERVWIQVRLFGQEDLLYNNSGLMYDAPYEWYLNAEFLPSTQYQVRGKFIPFTSRKTAWSPWIDVTTLNIQLGEKDVLDGSITSAKIRDAAITANKLMDEAVTSIKLAAAAVTATKIAVDAVTRDVIKNGEIIADKIANGAINTAKFAAGLEPVTIIKTGPLPTTKSTENINYNGELYSWNGSAYVKPETGVADGSITAAKLADAAVIASKLASGAVTHDKIVAGAIYGDLIAGSSITARELLLTDFTNLIANATFNNNMAGWFTVGTAAFSSYTGDEGSGVRIVKTSDTTESSIRVVGYGSTNAADYVAVRPGDKLRVQCKVTRKGGTSGGSVGLYANVLRKNGTSAGSAINGITTDTPVGTTVQVSGVFTVAEDTVGICFRVYYGNNGSSANGDVVVTDIVVNRMNNADLIVDGAVTANAIAASAITTDKLAANSITTAKIAAGAVTADEIAAGSILASKLVVADFTNMIPDANFQELSSWTKNATGTWTFRDSVSSDSWVDSDRVATYVGAGQSITAGAYVASALSPEFPVVAGDVYGVSGSMGITSGGLGVLGQQIQVLFFDINGSQLAGTYTLGNTQGGKNTVSGQVKAVNGAATAKFNLRVYAIVNGNTAGECRWFNVSVRKASSAELIVDGSIIADKLATNSVTTAKINAGAVTATEIATGAITTVKLAADSVTGDKIAANTITGDLIVANSITAKQLVLTDFTNLFPNGDFKDITKATMDGIFDFNGASYTQAASGSTSPAIRYATGTAWVRTGNSSLYMVNNATTPVSLYVTTKDFIPVIAGEQLYWEVQLRASAATTAGFYFRLYWYDATGADLSSTTPANNTAVTSAFETKSGKVTVPSGVTQCRVRIYNHSSNTQGTGFAISSVYLGKARGANLIVDGSITADMLSVNRLDAISATLGSVNISSAIIGTLQVGTSNIALGAVTAAASSFTEGEVSLTSGSNIEIQAVSVTSIANSSVLISGSFLLEERGAGNASSSSVLIQIYRGSTLLNSFRNFVPWTYCNGGGDFPINGRAGGLMSFNYRDTPGAGTFEYRIVCRKTDYTHTCTQRFLSALVTKR